MGLVTFAVLVGAALASAQSLPIEPMHESGASITGAFEGWFKNSDGSFSFLLGYFNRNSMEEVNIPVGENDRIEPGGPDRGQPTVFLPGRQWGMFLVKVPADFGDKKLTWTIVANGQPTVIPLSLKPDYEIAPFGEAAGNTPPVLSFEEHGATVQGPAGLTSNRVAQVGTPLPLTVWVSDDAKPGSGSGAVSKRIVDHPVSLTWTKYRGPGTVMFSKSKPEVEKIDRKDTNAKFNGRATTEAAFSQPGEYILHVTANDYTGEGGGGFQCCWTNGEVRVSVK